LRALFENNVLLRYDTENMDVDKNQMYFYRITKKFFLLEFQAHKQESRKAIDGSYTITEFKVRFDCIDLLINTEGVSKVATVLDHHGLFS